MSFLNILSAEQIQLLSEEQKAQIAALSDTSIEPLVIQFNDMLKTFFQKIEYCQHDNDYRPRAMSKHSILAIKTQIEDFMKAHPDFCNQVYLYGTDNYRLREYTYANFTSRKTYASYSFSCVSKQQYNIYCNNAGISCMGNYVMNSNETKCDLISTNNNFEDCINILVNKYNYVVPRNIEIYSDDVYEGKFPTHFNVFGTFKYINILKLRDDINIIRAIK